MDPKLRKNYLLTNVKGIFGHLIAEYVMGYAMFCEHTQFAEARIYRDILDSVWELMTVKNAKVNFEHQLEK
ncbi:DUF416 family protein, partial [Vibrio cholerae]|uniref:DUF416 family protein n=1 Tax=Vibrio cholerae TaxID=666 RepID=UPI003080A62F